MQRSLWLPALALMALAPAAQAVPDASGAISSEPAPDLSADQSMKARLNYNMGYELVEKAQRLEVEGASLSGAKARENQEAVRKGFSEARERFRTATASDPDLKEAWNLLGYTSRRLGSYEESLQAYDRALKLNPDYPEAIEYRAELFLLTGRLDDAKAAHAVLAKSSPSYADVLKQSMQDWLKKNATAPNVSAEARAAFASWVATL